MQPSGSSPPGKPKTTAEKRRKKKQPSGADAACIKIIDAHIPPPGETAMTGQDVTSLRLRSIESSVQPAPSPEKPIISINLNQRAGGFGARHQVDPEEPQSALARPTSSTAGRGSSSISPKLVVKIQTQALNDRHTLLNTSHGGEADDQLRYIDSVAKLSPRNFEDQKAAALNDEEQLVVQDDDVTLKMYL